MRQSRALLVVVLATAPLLVAGWAQAGEYRRTHNYLTSSADAASKVYVREVVPAGRSAADMGRAVLYVHGATFPGTSFDLPIAGYNLMTAANDAGIAAYFLDIRGYGNSTRPAAMDAPATENPPFSRASDAIVDIGDAVDFIRARAGVDKVSLVGWSWGTVTAGMYTAANNRLVDRLVLYAPVYSYDLPERVRKFKLGDPNDPTRFNPAIGAYRTVTEKSARARWEAQIVPEDKNAWREDRVFRVWYSEILATDPASGTFEPEALRAPNGVLVDVFEIFSGRPVYDAAKIIVPTLIVRGADDPTATDGDARGLLERLGASDKRYIVIPDATHFLSLERQAPLFTETVIGFLNEGG